MNTVQENSTQQPKKKSILFESWAGKWFVYRIPAFFVWYWLYIKLFEIPIPTYTVISHEYLLIPFIATSLSMLLGGKWLRLILFPFYVLFFWFIPAWYLFIILGKLFDVPIKVTQFAKSGRLIILLLLFIGFSCIITIASDNLSLLAIASLSLHIGIYLLFLQSFRWAANPYKPINIFLRFFKFTTHDFLKKAYIDPSLSGEANKNTKESATTITKWMLKFVNYLYPPQEALEKGITGFAYSYLVPTVESHKTVSIEL